MGIEKDGLSRCAWMPAAFWSKKRHAAGRPQAFCTEQKYVKKSSGKCQDGTQKGLKSKLFAPFFTLTCLQHVVPSGLQNVCTVQGEE